MFEAETFSGQLFEQLFDRVTFVKLFMTRTAAGAVPGFLHNRGVALFFAGEAQIQARILLPESSQTLPAEKIADGFLVPFADFDQVLRKLMRSRVAMFE